MIAWTCNVMVPIKSMSSAAWFFSGFKKHKYGRYEARKARLRFSARLPVRRLGMGKN